MATQATIKNFFNVVTFGHGQYVGTQVVDLFHVVLTGFVLLKIDAPAIQLLNHLKRALGIGHDTFLQNNPVIGDGNFLNVIFRCGVTGNDRIVEAVHSHADRTRAFCIGLFQQHHFCIRVFLLCGDGCKWASSAAAYH